jgi:cell division protease FtsH
LGAQQSTINLSYTSFLQQVQNGNVKDVTLSGNAVSGVFKTPLHQQQSGSGNNTAAYSQFTSYVPETGDPNLLPSLEKNGVSVTAQPVQTPWWQTALTILLNALPILLLVYFGYMALRIVRQSQQGGGIFGVGRSRAKLYNEELSSTTFADVAGADEAKADLREEIDFLREPQRYLAIGAHIPKGVLLVGPPGTGKTLLARAVAGEAGVPFYSASGTDFVELFVGVGASRVRDLFEQAKKNAPCIIFIDEIDAIGRTRSGASAYASNDEREQTPEQLLVEMDGFEPNQAVVVLAATNRPDVLDPALLRPGRFDRQITIDLPERRGREAILRIHTRTVPLAPDVNLADLARVTPGFSGADLENLVNEAALAAARRGSTQVSRQDFENALDKLLLGGKREALIDERERRIVAYHEGGHALVAALLPDVDPVYKVTIVPPSIDRRIDLLLECFQTQPCLLVLDNLESLLQAHDPEGHFRPGYEDYAALLRRVAETPHQSCLLLTSRETLAELGQLESRAGARALRLAGLEPAACEQLLEERDVIGSTHDQVRLAQLYAGNPLALKIVAEVISELFGGEISSFLEQGTVIFNTIRDLLAEQFTRLSALEQALLFWRSCANR